jgi:hypothetical protein
MAAASLATALSITSDIWVLLKGDKTFKINGAASRTAVDVLYFDGSTYSKIVDSSMLGNAHIQTAITSAAQTRAALAEALDVPDPNNDNSTIIIAATGASGSLKTEAGTTTYDLPGASATYGSATVPVLDGATTFGAQTDSAFRVGADDVVPGNTEKTRTLIQWWDNTDPADPTALEVAAVWADQIIEWGPNQPVFVE